MVKADDQSSQWHILEQLANSTAVRPLAELVREPRDYLVCKVAGITADFRKQPLEERILAALVKLAEDSKLTAARAAMFGGACLNNTESRAVLHTACRAPAAVLEQRLRSCPNSAVDADDVIRQVVDSRAAMAGFVDQVHSGRWRGISDKPIRTIVNIGIGGSHLGPELAVEALARVDTCSMDVRFLSNIDGDNLTRALRGADPATTLFVIASKSFGTLETAVNALSARSWFLERTGSLEGLKQHFVAVTNNLQAAADFGLPPENLFAMGDWVGGRYSLWSAVGLSVALGVGWSAFESLLAGAADMDTHFEQTPLAGNLPVLLALTGIWNTNFLGTESHAVLPYDDRLRLLPDYLQQLEMESNGKRVSSSGSALGIVTKEIIWGGRGTNGQHAFHQLLHQGSRAYSADFILCKSPDHDYGHHHEWLVANALAQSQAMAVGRHHDDPHRVVPGNHASTTLLLERLTPHSLGALLAAYEHKVFCQGVIWQINSFDQWGVELGKELAGSIHADLTGQADSHQDAATRGLIEALRAT